MATRNLTRQFKKHRDVLNSRRRKRAPFGAGGGNFQTNDEWEQSRHTLPPHWVDSVDEIKFVIRSIEQKIDKLHEAHRNRLLVSFDESEGVQDREIDILTKQITAQFRDVEDKLRRIGNIADEASAGVRKNIQRSLAVQLQGLSLSFRKSQKEYLARVKSQKNEGDFGGLLGPDPEERVGFEDGSNPDGFTDEQVVLLELSENQVEERDQEIQKIATSIQELATIFKELAVLVIDQGTVLDRIDYNMETVQERTQQGVKQLEIAEKASSSTRPLKCIAFLVIMIVILVIILVVKHT